MEPVKQFLTKPLFALGGVAVTPLLILAVVLAFMLWKKYKG